MDDMVTIRTIIVCIILAGSTTSFADDVADHLSLGHDRFTLATPDPKVQIPAVLAAKYGFNVAKGFKSYLGTGFAYTLLPEIKSSDTLKLRTGVAAQAGSSYQLGSNFSLSIDYKYLYIPADAQHVDPPHQSIGIGVNIKF
jgi:outer membrane protein W